MIGAWLLLARGDGPAPGPAAEPGGRRERHLPGRAARSPLRPSASIDENFRARQRERGGDRLLPRRRHHRPTTACGSPTTCARDLRASGDDPEPQAGRLALRARRAASSDPLDLSPGGPGLLTSLGRERRARHGADDRRQHADGRGRGRRRSARSSRRRTGDETGLRAYVTGEVGFEADRSEAVKSDRRDAAARHLRRAGPAAARDLPLAADRAGADARRRRSPTIVAGGLHVRARRGRRDHGQRPVDGDPDRADVRRGHRLLPADRRRASATSCAAPPTSSEAMARATRAHRARRSSSAGAIVVAAMLVLALADFNATREMGPILALGDRRHGRRRADAAAGAAGRVRPARVLARRPARRGRAAAGRARCGGASARLVGAVPRLTAAVVTPILRRRRARQPRRARAARLLRGVPRRRRSPSRGEQVDRASASSPAARRPIDVVMDYAGREAVISALTDGLRHAVQEMYLSAASVPSGWPGIRARAGAGLPEDRSVLGRGDRLGPGAAPRRARGGRRRPVLLGGEVARGLRHAAGARARHAAHRAARARADPAHPGRCCCARWSCRCT